MAKLYKTTGEIIDITPENGTDFTLKELQGYVGGRIEMLRLPNGTMIVNEEGKLKNLPINELATALIEKFYFDIIVGDVVVCGINEVK